MFSGRLSGRPLTLISRDAISVYLLGDFNETRHKYSPFEPASLKRFSRSNVKVIAKPAAVFPAEG